MRFKLAICLMAILIIGSAAFAQDRGSAEAVVKTKKLTVTYGRPSLRGRDMLSMAKVGTVWRLGMNEATEIQTAADLVVGGKEVKAGKYSLWAKKTGENQWVLAFHPRTGIWGQPEMTSGYVAEVPLKFEKAATPAEQLTISLRDQAGSAAIAIQWGATLLSGTVQVK